MSSFDPAAFCSSNVSPAATLDSPPTVRGTEQLAVLVPYQLGFGPHDCVVAVGVVARRPTPRSTVGESGGVVRVDTPPNPADVDDVLARARSLAVGMVAIEADDVFLLVYGADQRTPGDLPRSPHAPLAPAPGALALVEAAEQTLSQAGLAIVGVRYVEDARSLDLVCLDMGCCSPAGVPLPAPHTIPAVAELVSRGCAPEPTRDAVVASVRAGTDPRAVDVAHCLPFARAAQRRRPVRARTSLRRWRDVLLRPAVARALDPRLTPPLPDPMTMARLLAELEHDTSVEGWPRHTVRDIVLTWCDPYEATLSALPPSALALAANVLGPPVIPDAATARAIVERLGALLRCVPAGDSAPLSAVVAAVAWHLADGIRAGAAADQALALDPQNSLAGLVHTALTHGVRPPHASRVEPGRR